MVSMESLERSESFCSAYSALTLGYLTLMRRFMSEFSESRDSNRADGIPFNSHAGHERALASASSRRRRS